MMLAFGMSVSCMAAGIESSGNTDGVLTGQLGTLEPGKFADFVVFNKDYFTVPQAEIPEVIPVMTVVGGKTIVLREELANEWGVPAVGPQLKFQFKTEYDFGDPIL